MQRGKNERLEQAYNIGMDYKCLALYHGNCFENSWLEDGAELADMEIWTEGSDKGDSSEKLQ